jgi:hypothetical protein
MSADELVKRLFLVARGLPPSDHVPYAFEKRIMARLASQPVLDAWAIWSRLLWRAAAPCVGVMLVISVWTVVSNHSGNASETLAADFEQTVWGPLTSLGDSW